MNLAAFSINRNRITFTVLTTIMILGIVFYQSLSRDSMPPYTVRVATVVTSFPGSGPERVEQLVTDKVEKVVQEFWDYDSDDREKAIQLSRQFKMRREQNLRLSGARPPEQRK